MHCGPTHHVWSWGAGTSTLQPEPTLRCACGRVTREEAEAYAAHGVENDRLRAEVERLRTVLARAHNEGLHGVGCRGWDGQEVDPNRCTCWRSDVRAALAE